MAATREAAHGSVGRVARELKRPYVQVFGFLGFVTLIEVQVPGFPIEKALQILLLVATAIVKASLVALYYMHLRYEPRIVKLLPVGPLVFVALLILVVVLR